jgi:mono/diheme cytochrome c family protein
MKRILTISISTLVVVTVGIALLSQSPRPALADSNSEKIERGGYLVHAMGCADCHTPLKMGANGPEPDMSMMLAGHPESLPVTTAPKLDEPWMGAMTATMTAWAGPWGISYSSNLTPDPETGLGKWTEKEFVATVMTSRHRGKGRHLLPPMPTQVLQHLTEDDLSAVYVYLQSIPAVHNKVPEPKGPAGE